MLRTPVFAALVAAVSFFVWTHRAEAAGNTALAETLYRSGRDLMSEGKYAEACPKFAESYRLDPATGTLLNLATCHEAEGKFASAWVEFMDAAAAARRDDREDRVIYAEQHVRELEPKLSYLTIKVSPGVDIDSVEITVDGRAIGRAAIDIRSPLDPGTHTVEARAPGKLVFSKQVVLGAIADDQAVTIPELENDPAAPSPAQAAPNQAPVYPPPGASGQAGATSAVSSPSDDTSSLPQSVFVSGGITLALGAATVVSGVLYLERRSDYEDETTKSKRRAAYNSARSMGYVNGALLVGTLAAAAVTGYLYFDTAEDATAGPGVAPVVGKGFVGMAATGRF